MKNAFEDRIFSDGNIPLRYHFNMLQDTDRMDPFAEAIAHVVKPGAKVVDLGGGTGVLSFFAAKAGAKVWCVERDPALALTARRMLSANGCGDSVEVVHCDARKFTPPESVDLVVCEMLHAALVCEQQIGVIGVFKENYRRAFPDVPLPRFMPEATILAVQPVEQDFRFNGYHAPIVTFQQPTPTNPRTRQLAEPSLYSMFCYEEALPERFQVDGPIAIAESGRCNALRFATKNILAIIEEEGRAIEWSNQHMVLPLKETARVQAGGQARIAFDYLPGDPIERLEQSMRFAAIAIQSFGGKSRAA